MNTQIFNLINLLLIYLINLIKNFSYFLLSASNFVQRKIYNIDIEVDKIMDSYNWTVINGPFEGLIYKNVKSNCSSLYPKIIGTYENELNQEINKIETNTYDVIIDIGCAEGYYAVGLARKTHSKIIAVDINLDAINNCKILAKINNQDNRIIFNPKHPFSNHANQKVLVIMDCEGAEIDYIKNLNINEIQNFHFIIEVHDDINPIISNFLDKYFKNRNIKKIYTKSDYEKAMNLNLDLNLLTKLRLVSERRRTGMVWYIVK